MGLPRSGAILVESVLSSFDRVAALGEQELLPRIVNQINVDEVYYLKSLLVSDMEMLNKIADAYLSHFDSGGKPFFIDKLASNFWNIGLILSFVSMRKIFVIRNTHRLLGSRCSSSFLSKDMNIGSVERTSYYYKYYSELWDTPFESSILTIDYEQLFHRPYDIFTNIFPFLFCPGILTTRAV